MSLDSVRGERRRKIAACDSGAQVTRSLREVRPLDSNRTFLLIRRTRGKLQVPFATYKGIRLHQLTTIQASCMSDEEAATRWKALRAHVDDQMAQKFVSRAACASITSTKYRTHESY